MAEANFAPRQTNILTQLSEYPSGIKNIKKARSAQLHQHKYIDRLRRTDRDDLMTRPDERHGARPFFSAIRRT
jgi:hypothetical protein